MHNSAKPSLVKEPGRSENRDLITQAFLNSPMMQHVDWIEKRRDKIDLTGCHQDEQGRYTCDICYQPLSKISNIR